MKIKRMGVRIPPTETEREAMDVIYDVLSTGALAVAAHHTDPDDDWTPVWLVVTKTQGTFMVPEGMIHKHRMAQAVGEFARRNGAIAVGHIDSTWQVVVEDLTEGRAKEIWDQVHRQGGNTDGIPERTEQVMIAIYSASSWRMYQAPIVRHKNGPPTLEPFALTLSSDEKRDQSLQGAMVDPIREAIWRQG